MRRCAPGVSGGPYKQRVRPSHPEGARWWGRVLHPALSPSVLRLSLCSRRRRGGSDALRSQLFRIHMQRSSVAGMTKSRLPRGEGRILNHPGCDYDDCRQWKPAGKHKPGRVGLLAESWPTSFCCSDFSLLSRYATMIRGRGLWYREGTGDRDRGRRGATVHWRLQRKRGKN